MIPSLPVLLHPIITIALFSRLLSFSSSIHPLGVAGRACRTGLASLSILAPKEPLPCEAPSPRHCVIRAALTIWPCSGWAVDTPCEAAASLNPSSVCGFQAIPSAFTQKCRHFFCILLPIALFWGWNFRLQIWQATSSGLVTVPVKLLKAKWPLLREKSSV